MEGETVLWYCLEGMGNCGKGFGLRARRISYVSFLVAGGWFCSRFTGRPPRLLQGGWVCRGIWAYV
jgi:hypothetical protein